MKSLEDLPTKLADKLRSNLPGAIGERELLLIHIEMLERERLFFLMNLKAVIGTLEHLGLNKTAKAISQSIERAQRDDDPF